MDCIETPGSIAGKVRKVEHYSEGDLTQITLDDKVKCSILLEGYNDWPRYASLNGVHITCSYNNDRWDVQKTQVTGWKKLDNYLKPSSIQYQPSLVATI
jgi:hypothetical protein